jgi:hypothetical protein
MNDRARLDDRQFALCQRLEALASQLSELEKLRDRVAEVERKIYSAGRKARNAGS